MCVGLETSAIRRLKPQLAVAPQRSFYRGLSQYCLLGQLRNAVAEILKVYLRRSRRPIQLVYRGADKSLARPTSRCILFDGENISFDASLVMYINSTNIPPIMIINRIYEHQNLLSL